MSEQRLPDTGGYYFDTESGPLAVVRRNVSSAASELRSGDAGSRAIGFLAAFAAGIAVRAVWKGVDK